MAPVTLPSDSAAPAAEQPARSLPTRAGAAPVPRPPLAAGVVAAFAALKLATHVAVGLLTPYGFHRDEFLYFAMGQHLRLWRMDFPPAIAILARAVRALLGDSFLAIHLVPALAGTAIVVLAALAARELGGGRFAQGLAMLAVVASPLFLRASSLFQPVVLDQLCWTLGYLALLRLARTRDPRWWIALGAAAGLGLLVKFSVAVFGAGVLAAALLTHERRDLRTRWPWLAALAALALGSPSVVGQLRLGWPVVGYTRELQTSQLTHVSALDFFTTQLLLGPALLLAVAGLLYLLAAPESRAFRVVGWACAAPFVLLALAHGKAYYVGPVYPTLFAAGATWLERRSEGKWRERGAVLFALRAASVVLLVAFGLFSLPFGLPVLPPAEMARYAHATGATTAVTTNRGEVAPLPQDYADMLGWEERVAAVARVWRALPPEDRARAVLAADNYGDAGALDFYGPRYGLPPAISVAGTYWFFGPGDKPGDVLVITGDEPHEVGRFFHSCTLADRVTTSPWVVSEERDVPIVVCRGPLHTLQEIWPSVRAAN